MLATKSPNMLNEWDKVLKIELRKVKWFANLTQHIHLNFWVPATDFCKVYIEIKEHSPLCTPRSKAMPASTPTSTHIYAFSMVRQNS